MVDKYSTRVASKKKPETKEGSPTPEASPERYPSSMAAPASNNPPEFSNEAYVPYAYDEQRYALGPHFQAPAQESNTVLAPHHQSNAYPSTQNRNYTQPPGYHTSDNYEATNTYHQQTPQAQAYFPYPAEQPAMNDVFSTYGESYTNSFAISEYPPEGQVRADQDQEHRPQLQTWMDETSNTNLPVNERLVRSNWE
jgi:hypothetical protein